MTVSPANSQDQIAGLSLAQACCRYADEKQASDLLILDLRGLSQLCDYFVLCSGNSLPHLKAIRDQIIADLSVNDGIRANHRDGVAESQWMVLDFIDVIVHIFHKDLRGHYALEDLWADAPRIDWQTGEPIVEPPADDEAEEA